MLGGEAKNLCPLLVSPNFFPALTQGDLKVHRPPLCVNAAWSVGERPLICLSTEVPSSFITGIRVAAGAEVLRAT
jgi:hypothetical protein